MEHIAQMLDELAEVQAALDLTRLDYDKKRTAILAQVQDQLSALDAEYQPNMNAANVRIAELTTKVKDAVIAFGASVKGKLLHAVYSKGRVTWDSKKLDGLMLAFPQLGEARKEGEPSVTIRATR